MIRESLVSLKEEMIRCTLVSFRKRALVENRLEGLEENQL